ncbi:MAG: AraC family transcriptional regulator [Clostridia bacterium]|nr:AraC family transcriptional regulator [Clostridia bacterium]
MEGYERVAVSDIHVMEVCSPKHRVQRVQARDFYALSYRLSGKIVLEAEDARVVSVPDSITFTPKGMSYRTSVREDTRMIVVHFRLVKDIDFRVPSVFDASGSGLKGVFEQLAVAYRAGNPNDFECMSIFYSLLAALERIGMHRTSVPRCAVEARSQIDTMFSDADLSIAELAEATGVSDSYLRRVFGQAYGESPLEYLMRVRVRNAKVLLESEYFTVSEVAARCGFRSLSYFIQSFRAQTGETPGAYRRRREMGEARSQ